MWLCVDALDKDLMHLTKLCSDRSIPPTADIMSGYIWAAYASPEPLDKRAASMWKLLHSHSAMYQYVTSTIAITLITKYLPFGLMPKEPVRRPGGMSHVYV